MRPHFLSHLLLLEVTTELPHLPFVHIFQQNLLFKVFPLLCLNPETIKRQCTYRLGANLDLIGLQALSSRYAMYFPLNRHPQGKFYYNVS